MSQSKCDALPLGYSPMIKLRDTPSRKPRINYLSKMAVWTGLEPATSCVTGRHSNQLNYQTECIFDKKREMTVVYSPFLMTPTGLEPVLPP
jgi:hypothetical protein